MGNFNGTPQGPGSGPGGRNPPPDPTRLYVRANRKVTLHEVEEAAILLPRALNGTFHLEKEDPISASLKALQRRYGSRLNTTFSLCWGGRVYSPLSYAVVMNRPNVVKYLIEECGADVNDRPPGDDVTPLMEAVLTPFGGPRYKIIKILVEEYDADVTIGYEVSRRWRCSSTHTRGHRSTLFLCNPENDEAIAPTS
eukprot:gb/GECG01000165.1/.p1 GENE.gb/GECG01000165.1/~~gb/GECG01000165.1/.p1  ORF type:complete len:196 (+),score=8.39 gb/GECG01000165.1/:1-588(+)